MLVLIEGFSLSPVTLLKYILLPSDDYVEEHRFQLVPPRSSNTNQKHHTLSLDEPKEKQAKESTKQVI